MRTFIVVLTVAFCLFAAAQDGLFHPTNFTKANEFTIGIEGAAVDHDGTLYALNLHKDGNVARIQPDGKVELFVELPAGSTPNGTRFHSDGSMLLADYSGHN